MLAGPVRTECLCDEHGQGFCGRKVPFPVFGQPFFDLVEQNLTGEQIERALTVGRDPMSRDKAPLGMNGTGGMMHMTGPWGLVDGLAI